MLGQSYVSPHNHGFLALELRSLAGRLPLPLVPGYLSMLPLTSTSFRLVPSFTPSVHRQLPAYCATVVQSLRDTNNHGFRGLSSTVPGLCQTPCRPVSDRSDSLPDQASRCRLRAVVLNNTDSRQSGFDRQSPTQYGVPGRALTHVIPGFTDPYCNTPLSSNSSHPLDPQPPSDYSSPSARSSHPPPGQLHASPPLRPRQIIPQVFPPRAQGHPGQLPPPPGPSQAFGGRRLRARRPRRPPPPPAHETRPRPPPAVRPRHLAHGGVLAARGLPVPQADAVYLPRAGAGR